MTAQFLPFARVKEKTEAKKQQGNKLPFPTGVSAKVYFISNGPNDSNIPLSVKKRVARILVPSICRLEIVAKFLAF